VEELRAKVDTLTTILAGGKTKSAEIVDIIPNWRKRTDAA
jgi:hypothetical protein